VGITRQQICTAIKQTLELQLGGSPNAHVHQTSKNRQRQRTQDQQPATSGRTGSLGGKRLVVEEKLALEFEFKGLALGVADLARSVLGIEVGKLFLVEGTVQSLLNGRRA